MFKKVICPRCGGSGTSMNIRTDCPVCIGNGYIKKRIKGENKHAKVTTPIMRKY